MGPQMFVDQRLRASGVTAPELEYIDAMGLDISKAADLDWLRSKIIEVRANLVVLDSLRRLMPSKAENDSDDMAPAIASVAKLARDTQAAILLVHHKGDSDKFFRGSTAIRDQADALFALLREGQADDDQGEDDGVRRLRCRGGKGKMRYAVEPPDVFLTISPADGGVAACDAPATRARSQAPTLAAVKQAILSALPAKTKTAAAGKVRRRDDDPTFRAAWAALEDDGAIAKQDRRWKVVVVQAPTEPPPPQLSEPTVSSLRVGATDGIDELGPERPDDTLANAAKAPVCRCDRSRIEPDEHGEERCGKCGHGSAGSS
jgi:hypothetical protein